MMEREKTETDEDIISRLKFLGQIRRGDKISTKELYVQPNNIYTSILRTFFAFESRDDTFKFISETIKKSFDLLKKYANANDKQFSKIMLTHILQDLEISKNGIQNIKSTYSSDVMFTCKIDTMIQEIDARIAEYNQEYFKKFGTTVKDKDVR